MNTKTIAIELTFGRQGTKHVLRAAKEFSTSATHTHTLSYFLVRRISLQNILIIKILRNPSRTKHDKVFQTNKSW